MRLLGPLLIAAALAAVGGAADARSKRPRLAIDEAVVTQEHAPTMAASALMPTFIARPAAESRWTLPTIANDYGRVDPYGFRLRMRGAGMKMRLPLDLN